MGTVRSVYRGLARLPGLRTRHGPGLDRDSPSRAYQGYGRGMDLAWIENLAQAVHGDLQPDCTLLLDLPVEVGLRRARSRSGVAADRFEAETTEFFERVRRGYLQIALAEPKR